MIYVIYFGINSSIKSKFYYLCNVLRCLHLASEQNQITF